MRIYKTTLVSLMLAVAVNTAVSQTAKNKPFAVSGTIGFSYEGYGLSTHPQGSNIYSPRRPWNQLRFVFTPVMKFGKDLSLPFNFNFAAKPTNFAGPYAGLKNQNLGQFISNPANNFGLNPKYKWAELLLGTQYIRYSELSTGDIGIFGAGIDLRPKTWRFKFFSGFSQQGIDATLPTAGSPASSGVIGAYRRDHWMFQIGKEKENSYLFAFNFTKAKDKLSSVTIPPSTVKPQEGVTASLVADVYFKKGWYIKTEAARSYFTRDLTQPLVPGFNNSFKPFLNGRSSTGKDWAGHASIGRKSARFDLGYTTRYIGAGFLTTGYPYLQPDKWDNTINTRLTTWKTKMNIIASIGHRINNLSNTSLNAKQFIGSLNWLTQFSDRFSTNISYNNFGFTSASGFNPYGIRNVSNDLGISANYNWSNKKRMNMVSLSYNLSKYDERDVITGVTTSNNTHTVLVSYIPVYFGSSVSPDFSVLYFHNSLPGTRNRLLTLGSSVSAPAFRNKMQLRGQLQYTIGRLNSFRANNNLIASCNMDYKLSAKLSWNIFLASNYFKYGDELVPAVAAGAHYMETNYRTGLQYKF